MFRHILVPTDLSGRNRRPLATALDLAAQARARVTLLHVVERVPHLEVADLAPFYRRLTETSRRRLERVARRFAGRELRVRAEVVVGDPAHEIVRAASRLKADLIVMGSHRIDPRRPGRGWGTTSYKVGILSRGAVLLVK